MNNKIGVFDSGIGGLSVLDEIRKLLPNENFIYYADSKNNPYGEKSDDELLKIVKNIIDMFIKENVKAIVIACNTATTRLLDTLKELYPSMIFIGTEPAIKIACDNDYKNILLLATPATISSTRTQKIIDENLKDEQNIFLRAEHHLANAIETKNNQIINNTLINIYKDYKDYNIDAIVLGCTHYPLIRDKIQNFFPKATIIDGNKDVSLELKKTLNKHNLLTTNVTPSKVQYIQNK